MTPEELRQYLIQCQSDPLYFRKTLTVEGGYWGNIMSPVQEKDFEAIDPALQYLAGLRKTMPPIRRIWRQRSRGYSKSTDMGSDIIWLMAFTKKRIKGFVAAGDRDQATFIHDAISALLFDNPWLGEFVEIQKNRVISKNTGSKIQWITSDANSSFGETPDITILDELTHWPTTERGKMFFDSCISSFGKRADKGGVLSVGCNAGWGRDYQWSLRETARTGTGWHFSCPPGASPWYSKEMLDEQRSILEPSAFSRLYDNQWQDSGGTFVTEVEAHACVSRSLYKKHEAEDHCWAYVVALDYAEKKDRTVGVVAHLEDEENIIVDRMDVVDPSMFPDGVTPVTWCEEWLRDVYEKFGTGQNKYGVERELHAVVDKTQLLWLIQKYTHTEEGLNIAISPFPFASGKGNHELSRLLRQHILHQKVHWYEGCGQIEGPAGLFLTKTGEPEDLCTELTALTVVSNKQGQWKLDHTPGQHDDRAFALGAVIHYLKSDASYDR